MYFPEYRYDYAYSLKWLEFRFALLMHERLVSLNYFHKCDRIIMLAYIQNFLRMNQINFNKRFPEDVAFVSLNMNPWSECIVSMISALNIPNYLCEQNFVHFHDIWTKALRSFKNIMDDETSIFYRAKFEEYFRLHYT